MLTKYFEARDINGAREELLNLVQRNIDNNIIYFDGWVGFGAAAVLRSIAQAVPAMKAPPPELQFGRTICIDCSTWISKRVMQRRIAEELKLGHETMALFDKQDEEDDFYGVDQGSRDVIRKVSAIIQQTLIGGRFLMLFLNGSDEEVFLSQFGIPEYNCVVIWAFRRWLFPSDRPIKRRDDLRYTTLFISGYWQASFFSSSQISAVFREEAGSIVARHPCMWDIDPTVVTVCCLYRLLMQHIFQSNTIFAWTSAHAPNYWMCDGIIKGSRAREISNALHKEISFSECDADELKRACDNLKEDPKIPFVVVTDDNMPFGKGSPRWVSITLKYKKLEEDTKTLLTRASSIFIQFQVTNSSSGLPNGLFQGCSNLAVLTLSCCAFSFAWPPFLHCNKLRFLGLDHCTDLDKAKLEEQSCSTKWTCLHSLYVLDLRYTCWEEILSEEKVDRMANIMELNIEGVRDWQYTNKLQKRLPYLQRLRIIKPPSQANKTSMEINESFRDKKRLEILDLSGNSGMENLPTSLSLANKLEVLVIDGCCGLENVVLTNSSLRSFSFDAYGAASQWTSASELLPPESTRPERPSADVDKKGVKTSKISLEGCAQLKNVFLRGLPNLVELDLSGSAIKVLDFKTMVVDVPNLKRLFLLGCEHLRSIRWGPGVTTLKLKLELLCIDTRPWPGRELRASIVQHKTSRLQINAITVDARLSWSLNDLLYRARKNGMYYYFNISITSSRVSAGVAQPEETNGGKVVVATLYGDICNEVGPMWDFPQPPTSQSDRHIEIGDGSRSVESELQSNRFDSLRSLMRDFAQSLHVHDSSIGGPAMPAFFIYNLKWCRVERCPNLNTLFPLGESQTGSASRLETIWASDLLMARSIWTKGFSGGYEFRSLQHLHLRSCPSLKYALPVCKANSVPSLKTLYIIHCGGLVHVFVRSNKEHRPSSVGFPKLTKIHLHDLPSLQQICEGAETQAPALESTRIRGCWSLRRMPALKGRAPGMRRPTVEIEKDVWDALEWGGVESGHHPSLYEAPVQSRYYTKRPMPRGTVLR